MSADSRLHHIGYVVRDIERAIRRFVGDGAELVVPPTADPLQRVHCALVRLPEGADIELVSPIDPEDSPLSARLQRGGGLDHLCFEVDDLDAALARETARDEMIVCPRTFAVTFGTDIAFVLRRSGLLIEYMEAI